MRVTCALGERNDRVDRPIGEGSADTGARLRAALDEHRFHVHSACSLQPAIEGRESPQGSPALGPGRQGKGFLQLGRASRKSNRKSFLPEELPSGPTTHIESMYNVVQRLCCRTCEGSADSVQPPSGCDRHRTEERRLPVHALCRLRSESMVQLPIGAGASERMATL